MNPPRLRDQTESTNPIEKRAAQLVSVMSFEDLEHPAVAARVWRRLGPTGPRARRWLRPVVAAGLLFVGSGALAAVTVGRPFLATRFERLFEAPPAATSARAPAPRSSPPPPASLEPVEAPAPTVAPKPAPRPAPTAKAGKPKPAPAIDVAPPPAQPSSEEARIVMNAMSTLRSRGDAASARRDLEGYLTRYPRGVLVEEALGLLMEAARTPREARAAAERYLARFPQGRFAAVARKTLERP